MKASDYLRQFEERKKREEEAEKEHTLQENAKERAKHPDHLNAGTAYDWEDLEDYKRNWNDWSAKALKPIITAKL